MGRQFHEASARLAARCEHFAGLLIRGDPELQNPPDVRVLCTTPTGGAPIEFSATR